MNGAAARKFQVGDEIIIMSFGSICEEEANNFRPKVIFPDEDNKIDS